MHETGPFSIPAIRDFVPPKLRPWIIIAFVIVFQFSGGLYWRQSVRWSVLRH